MAAPHSHILIMYSHERTDAFCATASALANTNRAGCRRRVGSGCIGRQAGKGLQGCDGCALGR